MIVAIYVDYFDTILTTRSPFCVSIDRSCDRAGENNSLRQTDICPSNCVCQVTVKVQFCRDQIHFLSRAHFEQLFQVIAIVTRSSGVLSLVSNSDNTQSAGSGSAI